MGLGTDVTNLPVAKMVKDMAFAIAQGQAALDLASLQTAIALASAKVSVIPEFTEVIQHGAERDVGGITVTGIDVTFDPADPVEMTLFQAGIQPTFYQFTETFIEAKLSIHTRTETKSDFEAGASLEVKASVDFFIGSASATFASHVNYKTSNTFSYSAEGSSVIRTTLKPVPAARGASPRIITVNALKTPPEVTITQ